MSGGFRIVTDTLVVVVFFTFLDLVSTSSVFMVLFMFKNFLVCSSPFSELSMVGLALNLVASLAKP